MAFELVRVRREFVANVSKVVIWQLLGDLSEDGVLTHSEKDSILKENKSVADMARGLIDTVRKKGDKASRRMMDLLQSRDPALYDKLSFGEASQPGPSKEWKLKPLVNAMDYCEWVEVEPVVDTVDGVQTYSFQSNRGFFEYSVCGLRWVCEKYVHFTYQYCSWQEHTMKPSCTDYMPAGPLLDITVRAGKLEEVQLPHWICVDDISKMSDAFRVLHVETCGEALEKVSEVTSSRVKLLEPNFSPIGAMIRKILGFPLRVFYDTLIYKTNKEFLTLDVYLVPPDPALQQKVEREQNSCGSIRIRKPGPDESLQAGDNFSLTTDNTEATIQPSARKLRDDGRSLFEMFLRNADSDFTLRLESGENTVWTCSIHKGDYQGRTTDRTQGQHFVDLHRTALINRVSETGAVLDGLKDRGVISSETYDAVSAIPTTRDQMRRILKFVTATTAGKDALHEILRSMKSMRPLLNELVSGAVYTFVHVSR